MDLLAELKTRTRPHHERIEAGLNPMREGLTRADYEYLLAGFYGFYAPWEDRAATALRPDLRAEFDRRRKAPALDRDLRFLGADPAGLPRCARLPPTDSAAAVLGAMYVVEGSTLGGQHIARHLARTLGVRPGAGCDFFSGYGDETGAMWKQFRAWLTAHGVGQEEVVVAAAADTFDRLGAWMSARR
ncbi:MAG TPA: biliverdin-producing heme oxygenase [Urbifossiella sp.]|jgi:heme oxygenase|nr:biliverdin-producing heme oxygenase [Urbifossiella sp.]